MMRILLSIFIWLLVFSTGMLIYWASGGNFERNLWLGLSVFGSVLMATLLAPATYDILKL